MPQSWGPTRCRLRWPRRPRTRVGGCGVPGRPAYAFARGARAAGSSGAGPREPGGGGYKDNLGRAYSKQPLGCRLGAFGNPMPEARPFLRRCGFFLATRLGARAACSRGGQGHRAGTLRSLTPAVSGQAGGALRAPRIGVCDL